MSELNLTQPRWPEKPTHLERQDVLDALDAREWTNGFYTDEVEARMREITGAAHCVAFNSCTSALHAALAGIYSIRNTKVLHTTPLTFVGTVTGAGHLGLDLDYLDVQPDTLNIDRYPDNLCGPVLAVDLHGVPHQLDRTRVITDACQSLGTRIDGQHVGSHGTHAWSFSASKLVAAPDGGAITTNDSDYAERLRLLRDYGVTPGNLHAGRANGLVHRRDGHNWRPSELTMALVAHKLNHLTETYSDSVPLAERARTAGDRLHAAAAEAGIWHQEAPEGAQVAWHKVRIGPTLWDVNPLAGYEAARMRHALEDLGVPCHVWGRYPLNQHPAYRTSGEQPAWGTPIAERAASATFCLGTEACPPLTWTETEISQVCDALLTIGKVFA